MSVVADDVERIIDIDAKIKQLESEVKDLKSERREVEDRLVEEWGSVGKQSENRNGFSIYKARDLQCSTAAGMGDRLREACKAEGLGDFVKEAVVIQSLKSYVREHANYDDAGELDLSNLPASIVEAINVHERHVIRVRRA